MILCLCPNPSIDKFVWLNNLEPGKVNRVNREQFFPGGKGVHVALGIKELGETSALLGFWGGETGRWIKNFCVRRGISCYGPEIKTWNRTCLTFKSESAWNETELLGMGPVVEESELEQFRAEYKSLLKFCSAVCMCGSWPKSDENLDYNEFINMAKSENKKTFVDCSGGCLVNALACHPYAVHINRHEGYEIFNLDDPLQIAGSLTRDCELAAVTGGADGLYLSNGGEVVHAVNRIEHIISAVGSGDCLMAGLAVADFRNLSLMDTVKLSAACGTANCLRNDLGMFYKKDADLLFQQSEVTHIS